MAAKKKSTSRAAAAPEETTDQRRLRERLERRQALRVTQKIAPAEETRSK